MNETLKVWLALFGVSIIILGCMAYVGRKMYVLGGKVACQNSDSRLSQGFRCEPIRREPITTEDLETYDFTIP